MISCKKRKPAPLAGLFSISAENDFGEILRNFWTSQNLGNTYIFTHSVFIDKSVYSCNNEEDEGEIPPEGLMFGGENHACYFRRMRKMRRLR